MERPRTPPHTLRTSSPLHEAWASLPQDEKIRVTVPQRVVFGIQPREEYRNGSSKRVKAELNQHGREFLERNPVFVVAVWSSLDLLRLILVDGHHRARYAPRYGIRELPCEVSLVESLEAVTNYAPASLAPALLSWVEDTMASFGRQDIQPPGQSLRIKKPAGGVQALAQIWSEILR